MSATQENPRLSRLTVVFFGVCLLLLLYALFLVFLPFFNAFVWACALCVVFLPIHRRVLRLTRGQRTVASLVTSILVLILLVLPLTMLGVMIVRQSVAIYHAVEGGLAAAPEGAGASRLQEWQSHPWVIQVTDKSQRWLGAGVPELKDYARDALRAASNWVVGRGASLLAGFGGVLFNFILVFIMMFFFLRDGPAVLDFVRTSNPLPAEFESRVIRKFEDVSYATFVGSILTALVQGAVAAVLFWSLSVPSPLFWGAIVAFVSLLPIVGAFLVWIPMSGYLMITGEVTRGVILLAVGGLVVSSIDNFLKPMIIKERTDMHPLLVFLSVMGGMQVFGFLGVLLGPLIVAVFITSLEFYRQEFPSSLGKRSRAGGPPAS